MDIQTYCWITYVFTFVVCLMIPSKMSWVSNLSGSAIVALFGFIVWPLMVIVLLRMARILPDNRGVK